ncbi:MAG: hypothetical protein ACOC3V_03310 [bacterium]
MITEKIYSNILDKDIQKNLQESPMWGECYNNEDKPDDVKYRYTVKFEGLTPVQVTKIEEL